MSDTEILDGLLSALLSCKRSSKPGQAKSENIMMRQDNNIYVILKTGSPKYFGFSPREAVMSMLEDTNKPKRRTNK
jgi:hypothetical protein